MPPLPRLLHHHLSLSLLRRHSPRQPCPPAAYVFLHCGLASSSSPASAAAAGREKSSRRTLAYLLGVAAAMVSASYAAALPPLLPGHRLRRHRTAPRGIAIRLRSMLISQSRSMTLGPNVPLGEPFQSRSMNDYNSCSPAFLLSLSLVSAGKDAWTEDALALFREMLSKGMHE